MLKGPVFFPYIITCMNQCILYTHLRKSMKKVNEKNVGVRYIYCCLHFSTRSNSECRQLRTAILIEAKCIVYSVQCGPDYLTIKPAELLLCFPLCAFNK